MKAITAQQQAQLDLIMQDPTLLNLMRKQVHARQSIPKDLVTQRNALILADLQMRGEDGGFKWQTADILAHIIAADCIPSVKTVTDLNTHDRKEWLKKIQTRKQLHEKTTEFQGKVGYKPTITGIGDPVAMMKAKLAHMSDADKKAMLKELAG